MTRAGPHDPHGPSGPDDLHGPSGPDDLHGPSGPDDRQRVLTELLERSAARGLRIATRLVGSADAQDAVQEALARTVLGLRRVREPEAWFIRVLVNHCIGMQRRRRLWQLFTFGERTTIDQAFVTPGPADDLDAARHAARLRRTVERLSAMQRTVILLRFGEDLAIAAIAEILGISDETVKTHLARALARLRKEIGSHR